VPVDIGVCLPQVGFSWDELHDRAEPETLRLLADEVVPAARDL
jgi:hypothetical protein